MNNKWILLLVAGLAALLLVINNNTNLLVNNSEAKLKSIVATTPVRLTPVINKEKTPQELITAIIAPAKDDVILVEEALPETIPVEEWRKPSKAFQPFFELNNKALNTKAERENYKLLIDSGKLLAVTEKVLLAKVTENKIDYVKERARLDALYYLSSIISGKYNSSQFDLAIELATEVLNHPTVRNEQGPELKKSLLGDKIEIGLDLAVFQPELWDEYKSANSGDDKHQQLLAYIDNKARFQQKIMLDRTEKLARKLKQRQPDKFKTEH
ncbi:hypothetical protein HQQ94_19250 [Shewanella sp. VB17]|uniref:hypothetical protein n=1 Tax=Shewanella sp. VB17 TaxID=2739432 RepID=UPI001564BA03|nr:hypothetical protein [Shewanella sp. VB17]NRD75321.1 hypothetical protein [Shewanella sp. VB17]